MEQKKVKEELKMLLRIYGLLRAKCSSQQIMKSTLMKDRISIAVSEIKNDWLKKVKTVFEEATIIFPMKEYGCKQAEKRDSHRTSGIYSCRNAIFTKSLSGL